MIHIYKIKPLEGKVNANFHNDKIPKECSYCLCVSVVLIDSIFKTGKDY